MTKNTRPAPFFIADNRALDFLNSVASPSGKQIEWLCNGSDLLDWLEQAKMVSAADLKQFRKKDMLAACDTVAIKARELREWFRAFVIAHAGRSLDASAFNELGTINKLLENDSYYRQIGAQNLSEQNSEESISPLHWQRVRRWRRPEDLLLPIAEAMGELVCDADFWHVKQCEGPTCTMLFNDISKNHTRRWCTMSVCGNRAKAAQHRARKKLVSAETKS